MEKNLQDNEIISLKTIIVDYLSHWKLFLIAFCFSVLCAGLYLYYYPTTYELKSMFKLQDDKDLSSGNVALGDAAGLMKSFGLSGTTTGMMIDDELATLESYDIWRNVVKRLHMEAEYVEPLTWNYRLYKNTPFIMEADSLTKEKQDESVEFTVKEDIDGKIKVKGETKKFKQHYTFESLPAVVIFKDYKFVLSHGPAYKPKVATKLYITMKPAGFVAEDLVKNIELETYSDNSNVIECTYQDYEKERGIDILNTLMFEYNNYSDITKNKEAVKAIEFFNHRINEVVNDLTEAELAIEKYKLKNKMTDLEYDVQLYVDQMKEVQTKIVELEAQEHAIKFMEDFVRDSVNKYNLVPVLMNVQEGEKGGPLSSYNALLVERQRMLQNSKLDNPLFAVMDKQLDQLRNSVFLTIRNAKETLSLTKKDLQEKERMILSKMGSVPTQEREFLNYKRNQEIAQGVYLVLLQKREEAMLRLGRSLDRALVIDAGYAKSLPVGPRKLYAAIAILLLTVIMPVVYLFCRDRLVELYEEFKRQRK